MQMTLPKYWKTGIIRVHRDIHFGLSHAKNMCTRIYHARNNFYYIACDIRVQQLFREYYMHANITFSRKIHAAKYTFLQYRGIFTHLPFISFILYFIP
jgi:hypothetical protein